MIAPVIHENFSPLEDAGLIPRVLHDERRIPFGFAVGFRRPDLGFGFPFAHPTILVQMPYGNLNLHK